MISGKQIKNDSLALGKLVSTLQDEINKILNRDPANDIPVEFDILAFDGTKWFPRENSIFKGVIKIDSSETKDIPGKVYRNISDAVTYANTNATETEPLIILLTQDITLTSQIVLTNPWVSIRGIGYYESKIYVDDSLAGTEIIEIDYTTVQSNSPLGNLNIIGSATLRDTPNTYGVCVKGLGVIYLNDLRIQSFDVGLYVNNLRVGLHQLFVKGGLSTRDCATVGASFENTVSILSDVALVESPVNIEFKNNSIVNILGGTITAFTQVGSGIGLKTNPGSSGELDNIFFTTLLTACELNGGDITFNSCVFERDSITNSFIINAATEINSIQSEVDLSQVVFNAIPNIKGSIVSTQPGLESLRIFNETHIGQPNVPNSLIVGEGSAYTSTAHYFEDNGTTISNVKSNIINDDANTWVFPNNNTGTALYISNFYTTPFFGLNLLLEQPGDLGSGNFEFQYWDGTSWVQFNHMVTADFDKYISYGNNPFDSELPADSIYNVRFDSRIQRDWAISDPLSLGINSRWIRIIITSPITTSPEFRQLKLQTNNSEINRDGFIQHFGNGRPFEKLPISFGNFAPNESAPGDENLYLSDTLYAGRQRNSFASNKLNRIGTAFLAPYNLDTSCPLSIYLTYALIASPSTTGDIEIRIRWDWASSGDAIYDAGPGFATTPTQGLLSEVITIGAGEGNQVKELRFELPIPEVRAQAIINGEPTNGDLIFVAIERDPGSALDTFNGSFEVAEIGFFYISARAGGHIKAEL